MKDKHIIIFLYKKELISLIKKIINEYLRTTRKKKLIHLIKKGFTLKKVLSTK